MMINKLSKFNFRHKTAVAIVSRLLITAVIVFFAILPLMSKIKDVRNDIITNKIELNRNNTQSQTYSKLAQTLEEIDPQMEKLDDVFINRNRELEFITTLEGIAQKNNVTQTIKLGDMSREGSEAFTRVPLDLSISGNDTDTFDYLLDLENLVYYINVNTVNIAASAKASRSPSVNESFPGQTAAGSNGAGVSMHISANTYWRN